MKKLIIIINGRGGSGKDTFCEAVGKRWSVMNVSSITPIKELALLIGWDGEKDPRGRLLLSRLKEAMTDYSDLPNRYLLKEYENFLSGDSCVMFVHIREQSEMDRFRQGVDLPCRTLLVTMPSLDGTVYGNPSDDLADSLAYDYTFVNDGPLDGFEDRACVFFTSLLKKEGIC